MVEFIISVIVFWIYLSLLSIGLQFIYGVVKILNLAHASFFVIGGYLVSYFYITLKEYITSIILTFVIGILVAFAFYTTVTRLMANELYQLFFTFSLFWIIEGLLKLLFGYGLYNTYDISNKLGIVYLFGSTIPMSYIIGGFVLVITVISIYILLFKTTIGLFIRATIDRPDIARAFGINISKIYAISIGIGIIIAIIGGAISSWWQNFSIGMAGGLLVYAFAVVAMAGLGNIYGALLTSLLVSILRTFSVFYFPELELLSIYVAVVGVLAVKPSGLFTRYERRV